MIVPGTQDNIRTAVQFLIQGDVVGFPTETVYGLGALYDNESGIRKIFELKRRNPNNPLIIHSDSIDKLSLVIDIESLSAFQKKTLQSLSIFWPGALSIVLPCKNSISKTLTAGNTSVAFRIPSHPLALQLIRESKSLIAAPSANISQRISPTSALHVEDEFGESLYILDGGASEKGLESTVVSLLNNDVKILRPGSITAEILSEVLQRAPQSLFAQDELKKHSPGHEKIHYSPKTPLFFIGETPSSLNKKITVYLTPPPVAPTSHEHVVLSPRHDEAEVASVLYATLRELDKKGYDAIEIEKPSPSGIGVALLDRLTRAHYPV